MLDALRIDVLPYGFGNLVFGRQGEQQFFEGGIEAAGAGAPCTRGLQRGGISMAGSAVCSAPCFTACSALLPAACGYGLLQHQALGGFRLIKRVGIVRASRCSRAAGFARNEMQFTGAESWRRDDGVGAASVARKQIAARREPAHAPAAPRLHCYGLPHLVHCRFSDAAAVPVCSQ